MKPTRINDAYEVILPDHIASWDALAEWERMRFESMETHLRSGDVLVDVGTEQGALSAVYAQFVAPAPMVLIEPEPLAWRCIRETWEANNLPTPLAVWPGLVGASTRRSPAALDFDTEIIDGWPAVAFGDEPCGARAYRYLHEHSHSTPQTTLDAFLKAHDIVPDAITIDVEGAELEVLKGARQTLKKHRPLVWLSVHPDLAQRDYGASVDDIFAAVEEHGYERTWLGTDHEEHQFFVPKALS